MKNKSDLVKEIIKKSDLKRGFGSDPNDPWSAKANIEENITSRRSDILKQFYKAMGYNPNYVSKNQKVAQSKTGKFIKWKRDHGIFEEDDIQESNEICEQCLSDPCICDDSHGFVDEGVGDPQAATQSPADGANGGEELAPPKRTVGKIVKSVVKKKMQENLYDWEKDDKSTQPYGKKPSITKIDGEKNIGDDKPNARLILKGGKTLTGQGRDTVEIDPMMKNRGKVPDYKNMSNVNQK